MRNKHGGVKAGLADESVRDLGCRIEDLVIGYRRQGK